MNHRVGKAEPDIGGGERGAGFTDQNGTSAAVASPPREPRTPLNARVHAYSADQVSDSVRPQMGTPTPPEPRFWSPAPRPTRRPRPFQGSLLAEEWRRYGHGPAVVESKRWLRPLDRRQGRWGEESAPSTQMLRYLRRVDDLTTGKLRWGILTNGRPLAPLLRRSSLGLRAVLRDRSRGGSRCYGPERWWGRPDRHWLNVFLLVFRRDAFLPDAADERIFHQRAIKEGRFHHASTCVPSWTRSTSVSTASRIGTTSAISTPPSPSLNATRRPHTAPTAPATCASRGRARSPLAIPTRRSIRDPIPPTND